MAPSRRPSARRPADPARRAAFEVLRRVHTEDAYANLVLPVVLRERGLSGRDAAFVTELVAGTLRREGSYDQVIAAAAGRPLTSLQPAVVDLLRLGTHSLLQLSTPVHAAVAATVDLAAATVGERVTGLVNAVLRRVAARTFDEWVGELSRGLTERDRLALATSHPAWVVEALADVLPATELEEALLADNVPAPVALAVRPGLIEVADLVAAGAEPGRFSPFAATWTGNPGDLAAVREGRAGVQDEGSQVAAWGLARVAAPAGPWLDLCSGPGGKTALLTGLATHRDEEVLAVEAAPHRAALVRSALRAYRRPGQVVIGDSTRPAWRARAFSRVLADVPCTGLGALRRRPESRWRRRPDDVESLHPLQLALLRSAIAAVAVGGVVAYVTCSPHRRETVEVVEEVLAERDDLEVVHASTVHPELRDATVGPFLQLWPHRHGTDAMFAAYLRRRR